jgi:hypothetical protein
MVAPTTWFSVVGTQNAEIGGKPIKIWNKMSTLIEIHLKRVKNDKLDENNWVVGSFKWVVG